MHKLCSCSYINYLNAIHLDANANDNVLTGVFGDPISDGINLVIQGASGAGNANSEDRISAIGGASTVFTYTNATGTSALRYDSGTFRVVYFAFPFEAIHGSGAFASRDTVMDRVLSWLCPSSVGVEEESKYHSPITNFQLFQNHPNPFLHKTSVRFFLTERGPYNLKVYDLTGSLVKTLVDKTTPGVGSSTLFWNGEDERGKIVPSGVYFYRLSSGNNLATKKMTFLR